MPPRFGIAADATTYNTERAKDAQRRTEVDTDGPPYRSHDN